LDKDWGTDTLRLGLQAGLGVDEILHQWLAGTGEFVAARQPYLLYD
jgi:hypothetical protein